MVVVVKQSVVGSGRRLALCAALSIGLVLVPAASRAQQTPLAERWFQRGTVMVGAVFGAAAFSDFQRSTARPLSGEVADFERRVSASTASTMGGWVAVWLNERVGVRAGAAYAPSAFTVRNDELAPGISGRVSDVEQNYAGLRVLLADATMLVRFPVSFGRVLPYGLAGAGIVRYWSATDGELPAEAQSRFAGGSWTGAAGVLGLGATVPLEKRDLLLVFELTDHISRTPLPSRTTAESIDMSGVQLQLEPAGANGTDRIGLVNNIRLVVGLVLPIR